MSYSNPNLKHPYHLVELSPWPILLGLTMLGFGITFLSGFIAILPSTLLITLIAYQWWRDVIREASSGCHTTRVQKGIYIGFLLFLVSELCVFFSLFWVFLHSSLAPSIEIGALWPPVGISGINPWSLPLLGTCVLLGSGFILTLGHHAFIAGDKLTALSGVFGAVVLGSLFVVLQATEYYYCEFTITDSVFGGVIFMTTGLHGLHVMIGVTFLIVQGLRLFFDHYTCETALGFESGILYWHFVDVVWIFVFILFYWFSFIISILTLAYSLFSIHIHKQLVSS
jgi:cytochrome c oxidase subunit 3